jgi:hypothetical protein
MQAKSEEGLQGQHLVAAIIFPLRLPSMETWWSSHVASHRGCHDKSGPCPGHLWMMADPGVFDAWRGSLDMIPYPKELSNPSYPINTSPTGARYWAIVCHLLYHIPSLYWHPFFLVECTQLILYQVQQLALTGHVEKYWNAAIGEQRDDQIVLILAKRDFHAVVWVPNQPNEVSKLTPSHAWSKPYSRWRRLTSGQWNTGFARARRRLDYKLRAHFWKFHFNW